MKTLWQLIGMLCSFVVIAGCVSVVGTAPLTPEGLPTAATPAPAPGILLTIDDLVLDARAIIGAERFSLKFRVRAPGSQTLTHYGMATRLGSQIYKLDRALPVIQDGKVFRLEVGPLPNLIESGKFDVEFWVVDSEGRQSNRLKSDIIIQ